MDVRLFARARHYILTFLRQQCLRAGGLCSFLVVSCVVPSLCVGAWSVGVDRARFPGWLLRRAFDLWTCCAGLAVIPKRSWRTSIGP